MKAKWIWFGALASLVAWAAGASNWLRNYFYSRNTLADQFKAKVAQARIAAHARQEKTDAAVAKVDAAVVDAKQGDPVAFANDLINMAGHDPITKG